MKGGVLAFGFKLTMIVDTMPIAMDMMTDTITSTRRLFLLLGFIYIYCRRHGQPLLIPADNPHNQLIILYLKRQSVTTEFLTGRIIKIRDLYMNSMR